MSPRVEPWRQLLRSERCTVAATSFGGRGLIECDVWRIGGGARFTVRDSSTGEYLGAGFCPSLDDAKADALAVASVMVSP